MAARHAKARKEHGGTHGPDVVGQQPDGCRGEHGQQIGDAQHVVRVEAVHQPTQRDGAQRAAHLEASGDQRGHGDGGARASEQRRQPARQQVDHQQAHEERAPDHQRAP
ncbi:hypothetical protein SDC9_102918 [bioreactor metagenome]|uniref:Uncharacterized protein n=1 Tax=bioreactor metagenome TaxID=1076179 RepID=A0A645ASS0_9ZZZZ